MAITYVKEIGFVCDTALEMCQCEYSVPLNKNERFSKAVKEARDHGWLVDTKTQTVTCPNCRQDLEIMEFENQARWKEITDKTGIKPGDKIKL